eukprot:bmy_14150T0
MLLCDSSRATMCPIAYAPIGRGMRVCAVYAHQLPKHEVKRKGPACYSLLAFSQVWQDEIYFQVEVTRGECSMERPNAFMCNLDVGLAQSYCRFGEGVVGVEQRVSKGSCGCRLVHPSQY